MVVYIEVYPFKKLFLVEILYEVVLNIKLSDFTKFNDIKIFFEKRHLFSHKAGHVDSKFIEKYNNLQTDSTKYIDIKNINKKTHITSKMMEETIKTVKEFINYIVF